MFKRIVGVIFLTAYEIFFLYFLIICVEGLRSNHQAYKDFRNSNEPSLYSDGYNDYLDFIMWVILDCIFLLWPWAIFLITCCNKEPLVKEKEPLLGTIV